MPPSRRKTRRMRSAGRCVVATPGLGAAAAIDGGAVAADYLAWLAGANVVRQSTRICAPLSRQ